MTDKVLRNAKPPCPRFTESIDAAVKLIPEGMGYKIVTDDWEASEHSEHLSFSVYATVHDIKRTRAARGEPNDQVNATGIYAHTHHVARAPAAAIALCIAALRARGIE